MELYQAEKMDWNYIYILCPYCIKNYNKYMGMEKYKKNKFKRVYHIYNTENYDNQIIKVKSNCLFSPNKFLKIKIDDSTLKIKK